MGSNFTKSEVPVMEPKKSPFQRLLVRLQLCPNKADKKSAKLTKKDDIVPPKPPLRTYIDKNNTADTTDNANERKQAEWINVPLKVPETNTANKMFEPDSKKTPIPPPRKNKIRVQKLLETPKELKSLYSENNASEQGLVPVDEPPMILKKEPVHICDGTHSHVTNVVNGKVIEGSVHGRDKEKHNKTISTISLPTHEDLKKKDEKHKKSPSKDKKKSSASSLPMEKKAKLSNSTAEKLESYMTRCKSFGSILPQKHKNNSADSDNESIDSWGGLDDWDLGIIEHDASGKSQIPPVVSRNRLEERKNISKAKSMEIPSDLTPKSLLSTVAPASTEKLNTTNSTSKNINRGPPPPKPRLREFRENRQSSDGISSYDSKCYPFKSPNKQSVFESDAFFTSEFLKHESQPYPVAKVVEQPVIAENKVKNIDKEESAVKEDVKIIPVEVEGANDISVVFDESKTADEDLLDTLEGFCKENGERCTPAERHSVKKNKEAAPVKPQKPQIVPRRKSGIGHSNLLKIIQDNSPTQENDNAVMEEKGSESIRESLELVEKKIKKLEYDIPDIDESKITPGSKTVEENWHQIAQRDGNETLSNITGFDTTLSDILDTSSVSEDAQKSKKHLVPNVDH